MKEKLYRTPLTIAAAICCELLKPFKISFIVGSKAAFFSLSQCSFPLLGKFGAKTVFSAYLLRSLYAFLKGFGIYSTLLYHIPTLAGALYLSTSSKLFRVALPLICITLFVTHPVGRFAAPYALYWLIPIVVPFLPQRFFFEALGSTFTTHAVGSIIWLYTRNLDAASWNGLISVVWAERLVFAVAMTIVYYGIKRVGRIANSVARIWHRVSKRGVQALQ